MSKSKIKHNERQIYRYYKVNRFKVNKDFQKNVFNDLKQSSYYVGKTLISPTWNIFQ